MVKVFPCQIKLIKSDEENIYLNVWISLQKFKNYKALGKHTTKGNLKALKK